MNHTRLQAIRRHLFFSVAEAACMISHTSEKAWRNWEKPEGHYSHAPVPADVAEALASLCDWRSEMIDNMERSLAEAVKRNKFTGTGVLWYASADDYASLADREAIMWRPHCSIIAELAACYDITLVSFDAVKYQAWLSGRRDDEGSRSVWAASCLQD